jgi:hypothetical protein
VESLYGAVCGFLHVGHPVSALETVLAGFALLVSGAGVGAVMLALVRIAGGRRTNDVEERE